MALLDDEIKNKSRYELMKKNRIDAILSFLKKPELDSLERFRYNKLLIGEYEKYNFDSTVLYLQVNLEIAQNIGDKALVNETLITLGDNLSNVGRSKEAEDVLSKVDQSLLNRQDKIQFYNVQRRLYENLTYYASTESLLKYYQSRYDHYRSELMKILPEDHDVYLDIMEKYFLDQSYPEKCLDINQERLERTRMGEPRFSLVTFQRFLIYMGTREYEQQKRYLILSAISDIRAVVKDNASLTILASFLYEEGNTEKAYCYIQSAYEDAINFNSILRFEEISKTLSPIARSYQQLSDQQKDSLELNIMIISLLSLVLVITIFFIYRQVARLSVARNDLGKSLEDLNRSNGQLKEANQRQELLFKDLSESNLVKEHYIGNFLNIQSEYIDKIDEYQKLVKRMLMGRKYTELMDQINSGRFVNREIKSFYTTFDQAFLSIYPGFIEQFNDLLIEGEAIQLSEGELLNTELRVFALIRLGVNDSSSIAKVLRYSVNTIYNYRVKIKNKARGDRAEFEKMVQEIDAF